MLFRSPRMDERGFIAHYLEDRVYPSRLARRVEVVVATVILGSWLGFAIR